MNFQKYRMIHHGREVYPDGTVVWFDHGLWHRKDGPARIFLNGTKIWYCHGSRHRIDGPAIIDNAGNKRWFVDGKCVTSAEEFQKLTGHTKYDMILLALKYGAITT